MMLPITVIFGLQILCSFASSMPMSETPLASHWKDSKLDTLVKAVATPIKSAPVTLVGWQNVLDDKGAVKEVRTIEVALEMDNDKKTHHHSSWPMYFGEEDLEEDLPYIMDRLHQEKERGINLLGASQTFDTEGKLVEMLMIDDSDIWMNGEEDDVYLMRNMTVKDMDEAKDWAATQNSASLLVFNPDGTFNEKESAVKPELSAYITGQRGATQEMMEDALKAVSDGYLMHRDNLAKYVVEQMDKEFPKYSWLTVSGHEGSYSERDVHIGVEYTLVGLHNNIVSLDIFGVSKP